MRCDGKVSNAIQWKAERSEQSNARRFKSMHNRYLQKQPPADEIYSTNEWSLPKSDPRGVFLLRNAASMHVHIHVFYYAALLVRMFIAR